MVSHDAFKNIILFALVVIFLYFLFRDKIHAVTEEPFEMPKVMEQTMMHDTAVAPTQQTKDTGAMTASNTGIDRSFIKSDEEIGILSTCQQNSGGELVKTCSEYTGFNFDYDKTFDKFLRPTSFDQPNFLKSTGR
jgi:hypothetical protein